MLCGHKLWTFGRTIESEPSRSLVVGLISRSVLGNRRD